MRKAIELAVTIASVALFVTPTGLRLGTKGKVQQDVPGVLSILNKLETKGQRRAVRRALHQNGHGGLAAAGIRRNYATRKAA